MITEATRCLWIMHTLLAPAVTAAAVDAKAGLGPTPLRLRPGLGRGLGDRDEPAGASTQDRCCFHVGRGRGGGVSGADQVGDELAAGLRAGAPQPSGEQFVDTQG